MSANADHVSPIEDYRPPALINPGGRGPVFLVCEHAVAFIPPSLGDLGLMDQDRIAHIAWDPGAFDVAERLSGLLDAPLVAAGNSRLVYDCNRPPEAESAIPTKSEFYVIPGNEGLSAAARAARIDGAYRPFETTLEQALAQVDVPILVTIHSFTPVYNGEARAVEIGILHDADSRLADALLADATNWANGRKVERNAPYGPDDGVTHTLRRHALSEGRPNVMIEIRNDLIADATGCAALAEALALGLTRALSAIAPTPSAAAAASS